MRKSNNLILLPLLVIVLLGCVAIPKITAFFCRPGIISLPTNGTVDLSDEVTKGTVPHFLQWDNRWGNAPYGDSTVAKSGCGPTCLAMVYACLTGEAYSPKTLCDFSAQNGYYVSGTGTAWKLMSDGAEKLGLKSEELPLDESKMKSALSAGKPLILSVGPGDFTDEGHFIVITGITARGDFTVHDPNSYQTSTKRWSMEELCPQILNIWAFSK